MFYEVGATWTGGFCGRTEVWRCLSDVCSLYGVSFVVAMVMKEVGWLSKLTRANLTGAISRRLCTYLAGVAGIFPPHPSFGRM